MQKREGGNERLEASVRTTQRVTITSVAKEAERSRMMKIPWPARLLGWLDGGREWIWGMVDALRDVDGRHKQQHSSGCVRSRCHIAFLSW